MLNHLNLEKGCTGVDLVMIHIIFYMLNKHYHTIQYLFYYLITFINFSCLATNVEATYHISLF